MLPYCYDLKVMKMYVLILYMTRRRLYTVRQKNCTFLFLQWLCQIMLYWHNYWYTYTLINLDQNIKIVNCLWRVSLYSLCEMQYTFTCYDKRWFCHVSLNIIIILNILMKHHIKCEMYGPTMQCNIEQYYHFFSRHNSP